MWKPIEGYQGIYEISDKGEVRRLTTEWYRCQPRLLSIERNVRYLRIRLFDRSSRNGKRFLLHRLVYAHFVGPIPHGLTVNHKNGDRHDNRAVNLELATMSEQMQHAYSTGLQKRAKGEARGSVAKLTEDQVRTIREAYSKGVTRRLLAERFGVSLACIYKIVAGTRWTHIV